MYSTNHFSLPEWLGRTSAERKASEATLPACRAGLSSRGGAAASNFQSRRQSPSLAPSRRSPLRWRRRRCCCRWAADRPAGGFAAPPRGRFRSSAFGGLDGVSRPGPVCWSVARILFFRLLAGRYDKYVSK